jgi:tetratricopeptide (TPR) repeat protein
LTVSLPALDRILVEAISCQNLGKAEEAEALYRHILASPSIHAVANCGLGTLCMTQGRLAEAAEAYGRAIAIQPNYTDAYLNLGTVALALRRFEEAITFYRRALTLDPGSPAAYCNLGKALHDSGRLEEAVTAYTAAIERQPDNGIAHLNLGAALLARQAWEDSVRVTRRAIDLLPDNAMAYTNLGAALLRLDNCDDAAAAFRRAVSLRPESALVYATVGGGMLEIGELQDAEAILRQAISLDPALPNARYNLSHTLKALNRLDEAANEAQAAIALCPDSAEYHFHLAHILLLQGDLEPGWVEYDWRWNLADFAWMSQLHASFSRPRWMGEDIHNKTILVHTEQGLGDVIQFSRYLPLLVPKAKKVIVATKPELRGLLETIEGIKVVLFSDGSFPDFDVYCPLLSLPRAFGTRLDNIPSRVPYLRVGRDQISRWDKRMDGVAPRVGIVWAGNPNTPRDRFRSPGLANVAPLLAIPGIDFVILQVGEGRDRCSGIPPTSHCIDLGGDVKDLMDTAAIMCGLDLMISSCSAPLHLAGALGIPTWAMIPFAPHFSWLLERTDTFWYPTVRLYRQTQPGNWAGVIDRMAHDLTAFSRRERCSLAARDEVYSWSESL